MTGKSWARVMIFKMSGCRSYRLNSELYPGNKIQLVGCCDNTPCCIHIIFDYFSYTIFMLTRFDIVAKESILLV